MILCGAIPALLSRAFPLFPRVTLGRARRRGLGRDARSQKQSDRRPSVGDQGRIWTWHPTAHRYPPRSPKSLALAIIAPKRTVDAEPCALGPGWFGEVLSCGSRTSTFVMARRLQLSVDDRPRRSASARLASSAGRWLRSIIFR